MSRKLPVLYTTVDYRNVLALYQGDDFVRAKIYGDHSASMTKQVPEVPYPRAVGRQPAPCRRRPGDRVQYGNRAATALHAPAAVSSRQRYRSRFNSCALVNFSPLSI